GWVDLIAFDPSTGTVIVIEIKTRLDDVGAAERQLGWYARSAFGLAHELGWNARRAVSWLLVLASEEVEATIRVNRDVLDQAFPGRGRQMSSLVQDGAAAIPARALGLIDPASHRRSWIVGSRVDGRRSAAPYRDYRDAARRLAA
ncbi:MAG: hypothetical protein ACJ77X_03280, partial [Chloroflexota bacterium]